MNSIALSFDRPAFRFIAVSVLGLLLSSCNPMVIPILGRDNESSTFSVRIDSATAWGCASGSVGIGASNPGDALKNFTGSDFSNLTFTLQKNTTYSLALNNVKVSARVLEDIAATNELWPVDTNELGLLVLRNGERFMVFASQSSNLLSEIRYDDEDLIKLMAKQSLPTLQPGPLAVGLYMKLTTGNTAGTETLTLKLARNVNKGSYGKNKGDKVEDLPSDLKGGLLDFTVPVKITVQ